MLSPFQSQFSDQFSECESDQFIMVGKKSKDPGQKQNKKKERILQKSLILVSHLPQWFSNPKIIQKQILFGRYGKIKTIIISSNHTSYKKKKTNDANQVQAYITYENDMDASLAIKALNGYKIGTRLITATYGTNRYCASIETNSKCKVSNCYFMHQKKQSDQFVTANSIGNQRQQESANKIISSNLEYFVRKIIADNLINRETKIYPSRLQSHTKFIIFPSIKQIIDEMIINGIILKYKFQEAREKVQIQQKTTKKSLNDTTKRIEYYRLRSKTQKNAQIPKKNQAQQNIQIVNNLQKCSSTEVKRSSSDCQKSIQKQTRLNNKIEQQNLQNFVLKSILQEKSIQPQKSTSSDKKNYLKKRKYIKKQKQLFEQGECSYLKLFGKPFKIGSDQIIQQYQNIQDTTTGSSNRTSREKTQTEKTVQDFPATSTLNKMKKQNSQKALKKTSNKVRQSSEQSYLVTKVTHEIMKNTILKRSKLLHNDACRYNEERQKQWKHVTKLMIGSLLEFKNTCNSIKNR